MPDPFKNVKIIELMGLFDDDEVTTADQMDRPQKALDREMFQNAFKEEKADGGRIGFYEGKLVTQGPNTGKYAVKIAKSKNNPGGTKYFKSKPAADKYIDSLPGAGGGVGKGGDKSPKDILTDLQKQKIKNSFPDTKFNFDRFTFGVKKVLPSGKINPDWTKVNRFKKAGFKLGKFIGRTSRGGRRTKRTTALTLSNQNKIKALFELPEGIKNWDFKNHKYGIPASGNENLIARMNRRLGEKKKWTLAADRGSVKGWMLSNMERVYNKLGKKSPYKPIFEKINGIDRIIGFTDNTEAGGGKTYYGLNKYTKKNATDITQHGDFKRNRKLFDITKRSFNEPNEVITGLLKDRGYDGKLNLNSLVQFLSGTPGTSSDVIKNSIVRHHQSQVGFGNATNDLAITTQSINNSIKGIEKRIANNIINDKDIQILKNNNISVRAPDGTLYGGAAKTPIGQFKQIEEKVATALKEGVDFKGQKFTTKKLISSIAKLGGGKCATQNFASGGRINLADSVTCLRQGLENIKNKNLPGGPQQQRIMKNLTDLTKTTQGARVLSSAARVAAGLGVGTELALGGFFAITDYATGANKQELLSNLTYGLAGKDVEEQLTEKDPMYGKAQQLEDVYAAYLQGLDKTGKPKTMDPRGMAQRTKAEDVEKAMEPFKRISPQTDTGQFFDLDMFETQKAKDIKALKDFEKEKKDRALKRGFYDPNFDVFSPDRPAAAGGGLLKQAGDRSGAPPKSGPTPHGLPGILKRAMKMKE